MMSKYEQGLSPIHNMIREILSVGHTRKWLKPHQIRAELIKRRKRNTAEGTVTRELRRMTDVENRYRKDDSWDYRLQTTKGSK